MDIANSGKNDQHSTQFCDCYKVESLTETILDSNQIARLSDRYVLGEQIGWGQFGVIRTCSSKLTGEVFACKSISKDRLVTRDDVRNVKLEIEIMTRLLGHPNVVDLKAVYEEEGYVHLVMELCAGGELFEWLEKYGRFSESDARVIFKHLMQVVNYCHGNGVIHRDLKPENILLATKSLSSPIKLADFGLATYINPGKNLQGTVGSPFYIAPEVLTGGYNQAADVWSAGVILYILLSGMPPFWGKTKSKIFDAVRASNLRFPSDTWDHISASARDLIMGMLCKDPYKRLTAAEVLAHSWTADGVVNGQERFTQKSFSYSPLEGAGDSFTTPLMSRSQDYSFSGGLPSTDSCEPHSYSVFTCKSSFSSFLPKDRSPCFASGDFSFSNCLEPLAEEFSSPISSMPSFSFLSPSSDLQPVTVSLSFEVNSTKVDDKNGGANLGKLFALSDFSPLGKRNAKDMELRTEIRRVGINGSRISTMNSKRNHTIGLGELDQLDLVVTESVIRWASCTQIPTTPSLRLSLVC